MKIPTSIIKVMLACCCTTSMALASPKEDALYIVSLYADDAIYQRVSEHAAKLYVQALARELSAHNVKVVDFDRFEALIPDSISEIGIHGFHTRSTRAIMETFTAAQLSEIVDFEKSDTAKALTRFSRKQIEENIPPSERIVFVPTEPGYDESKVKDILSEKQFQQFEEYYSSDSSKLYEEKRPTLALFVGMSVITAHLSYPNIEPTIYAPFMLEVLKARGIVSFSNPIEKRKMIEKVEQALN